MDERIGFPDVLMGLMKVRNIDLYVTGSNSRMLSTDVVTQFRDRGDEIHLNPLSFKEFYDAYPGDKMTYGENTIRMADCRKYWILRLMQKKQNI